MIAKTKIGCCLLPLQSHWNQDAMLRGESSLRNPLRPGLCHPRLCKNIESLMKKVPFLSFFQAP